jgi:hypothetical protein
VRIRGAFFGQILENMFGGRRLHGNLALGLEFSSSPFISGEIGDHQRTQACYRDAK